MYTDIESARVSEVGGRERRGEREREREREGGREGGREEENI